VGLLYNKLYNKSTANLQQIPNILTCQDVVDLLWTLQQIHNKSHPPSHTHYFIPDSKLTSSTNLFHHSLLAPTWTAFSDYNWTGLTLIVLNGFSFLVVFLSFYSCVVQ